MGSGTPKSPSTDCQAEIRLVAAGRRKSPRGRLRQQSPVVSCEFKVPLGNFEWSWRRWHLRRSRRAWPCPVSSGRSGEAMPRWTNRPRRGIELYPNSAFSRDAVCIGHWLRSSAYWESSACGGCAVGGRGVFGFSVIRFCPAVTSRGARVIQGVEPVVLPLLAFPLHDQPLAGDGLLGLGRGGQPCPDANRGLLMLDSNRSSRPVESGYFAES